MEFAVQEQRRARPLWREFRDEGLTDPAEILSRLGVRSPPVDPFAIARELEIEVRSVSNPGWDGALKSTPERAIVWVDRGDAVVRQRFTVAHEIGHLMLHELGTVFRDTTSMPPDPREREANDFAARLLMPEAWVRSLVAANGPKTAELAELFGVSEQAMSFRLANLYLRRR